MPQALSKSTSASHFRAGRVVVTSAAGERCEQRHLLRCLLRHLGGDWGLVSAFDAFANQTAMRDGERILSAYPIDVSAPEAGQVWILTEADRSVTTILLPEEF